MTRYGIDVETALRLTRDSAVLAADVALVAPTLLRSEFCSRLYTEVRTGRLNEPEARRRLDRLRTLGVRLLGDRVSQRTAWQLAQQLDYDDTLGAEYLAVARLQADRFAFGDPQLAAAAETVLAPAPSGAGYQELVTAQ